MRGSGIEPLYPCCWQPAKCSDCQAMSRWFTKQSHCQRFIPDGDVADSVTSWMAIQMITLAISDVWAYTISLYFILHSCKTAWSIQLFFFIHWLVSASTYIYPPFIHYSLLFICFSYYYSFIINYFTICIKTFMMLLTCTITLLLYVRKIHCIMFWGLLICTYKKIIITEYIKRALCSCHHCARGIFLGVAVKMVDSQQPSRI